MQINSMEAGRKQLQKKSSFLEDLLNDTKEATQKHIAEIEDLTN